MRLALAGLYEALGRKTAAQAEYERLAKLPRPSAVVLNNLAWLYLRGGDARALETARRAYELDSDNPAIMDTYGWALVKSGKVAEGLRILESAALYLPSSPEIQYHLAEALSRVGDTRRAREALAKALAPGADYEELGEARALARRLGGAER